MIIGDWGRKGGNHQKEVAEQMGIEARADSSRFIISAGDNFYESGVESLDDSHWTRSFEDIYTAEALQVKWYITVGNHDYEGNVEAQVSYTNQSDRWYLPSTYYKEEFVLEDSTHILFVFLDTNPLSKERIDPSTTNPELKEAAVQLKWFNETLSQSEADWRIVIGHHPLFSVDNKHRNDPVMIDNLQHLLERHGVHAYFSGHAHSLQHLKPEGTVEYFISGAGSKTRNIHASPITMAAESVPGFIAVSLTNETLIAQFVDFKGETHHEAIIHRQ